MTRPFRLDELTGPDDREAAGDLAPAVEAARLIERSVVTDGVRPSPGFTERVMLAVAAEPLPRRSGLAIVVAGLRSAWRVALTANHPPLVRARAVAIVLAAVVALGSLGGAATLAAAGALNLLQAHPSPLVTPLPQLVSPRPTDGANPAPTPRPSETAEPGETPEASDPPEASETPEPGDTPEPGSSDQHGGGSGGGSGGGGDGSGATARPTRGPEQTETPEPTETPETPEPSDH